jgi:hypothetical protein
MKLARCAVAMVALAAAVGFVIAHGVMAQSPAPTTQPKRPSVTFPSGNFSLTPSTTTEKVPVVREERWMDANGQRHVRPVYDYVPGVNPQPADPEAEALQAAEIEAAKEAQELVQKLQADRESGESQGIQTELKAKLRAALAKQFEAQQKQRTREIGSIEERLNKLKETLQKRDAAKDKIVDRRLDQLTGVRDELAWEETPGLQPSGNNRFPNSPSPYPPGLSPQPMGVPRTIVPRAGNTGPTTTFPMMPGGSFPVPPPTAPTLTTPVPAAPPVPPAPPARVIPSSGVPGTTPAPPVAPPAPPAPAATPELPAAASPPVPPTPRVPPTPARTP